MDGVALLLALIGATALHELGHIGGAVLVGAQVRGHGLSWRGPYLHVKVEPPCPWRARVNLLSGCACNALVALLAWGAGEYLLAEVNAGMVVFNLCLPWSDGWQAVKAGR